MKFSPLFFAGCGCVGGAVGDRLIYLVMLLVEELYVFIEELCIFAGLHFLHGKFQQLALCESNPLAARLFAR